MGVQQALPVVVVKQVLMPLQLAQVMLGTGLPAAAPAHFFQINQGDVPCPGLLPDKHMFVIQAAVLQVVAVQSAQGVSKGVGQAPTGLGAWQGQLVQGCESLQGLQYQNR